MTEGKIQLLRLYERQSARGTVFFVGKLNGVRVVVLKDTAAEISEGTVAVWNLFVQPDEPEPAEKQARRRSRTSRRAPAWASDPERHPDRPPVLPERKANL
jgi:hypothetical protein